jgi:hypothetical protein
MDIFSLSASFFKIVVPTRLKSNYGYKGIKIDTPLIIIIFLCKNIESYLSL